MVLSLLAKVLGITGDGGSTKNSDGVSESQVTAPSEIKVGDQIWMTRNLDVDTFRNGDPIPEAKSFEEWENAGDNKRPVWCYFNNDPANGVTYGKLYNWFAVADPRGLAPEGWHIPSDAEWTRLNNQLGSSAGKKIKSESGWNEDGGGTDEYGFNGLPGGARDYHGSFDQNIGESGNWWSSTQSERFLVWIWFLAYSNSSLIRSPGHESDGYSVRCIKDSN